MKKYSNYLRKLSFSEKIDTLYYTVASLRFYIKTALTQDQVQRFRNLSSGFFRFRFGRELNWSLQVTEAISGIQRCLSVINSRYQLIHNWEFYWVTIIDLWIQHIIRDFIGSACLSFYRLSLSDKAIGDGCHSPRYIFIGHYVCRSGSFRGFFLNRNSNGKPWFSLVVPLLDMWLLWIFLIDEEDNIGSICE